MTEWKDLLPPDDMLARIAAFPVDEIRIDPDAQTVWGSVEAKSLEAAGRVFVLSWDYVDVQFKFEMYVTSLDERDSELSGSWKTVATMAPAARIRFLVRAEWIRPAMPGEVPDAYEQVIEEGGRLDAAPASASVGGLGLRGIVLMGGSEYQPVGVIGIDDSHGYSLQWLSDRAAIDAYLSDCHVYDLDALRAFRKRVPHTGGDPLRA
jgi:hypothetical protein